MSTPINVDDLALELLEAQQQCSPVDPLTERFPDLTTAQAYHIQLAALRNRLKEGRRVVGKKIGLTSKAMQDLLGVNEPDYGHLLDDMVVLNGQPIAVDTLLQPRCEGEIAFLLGRDVIGPGVTVADVLAATEAVVPALEIVDSRVRDWKIKIQDTVADNASSALLVLGNKLTPIHRLDLRLVGMVLEKNGQVAATGAGAAVLGHPAAAVAWLANKLFEFDISLKAGEIILSGSLATAPPVAAGDYFRADFDRLGSVSAYFM
ncbi:MAG: fumarylacetoacetate hydrolase family protein [Anaerolineae bacterium]